MPPVSARIDCVRLNHLNVVLKDFDASVEYLKKYYGAEFLLDIPQREWHAGLVTFGDVIFEIFCPHGFLLNARHGPHYLGLEYQADMKVVREVIAANGIGIVRDIGLAVHTDPADCHGIAFEFYDGSFHERTWELLGRRMLPPSHWLLEHPLGLTGLKHCSVAVRSLDAAGEFFERLFNVRRLYERARPLTASRARAYRLGDSVIELAAATGPGVLQSHLERCGEGLRSTVFTVRDLEQAKQYFQRLGIKTTTGDDEGSIAIPAAENLGIAFEFAAADA